MKRAQTIYIALGKDPNKIELTYLCWSFDPFKAGEIGEELAKLKQISFVGIISVPNAEYEAKSTFPDNHPLNQ